MRELQAAISGLTVFAALKHHKILACLDKLLAALAYDLHAAPLALISAWSDFASACAEQDSSSAPLEGAERQRIAPRLHNAVICDTNPWTLALEQSRNGAAVPQFLAELAASDLKKIAALAALDVANLASAVADAAEKAGFPAAAALIRTEGVAFDNRYDADLFNPQIIAEAIKQNGAGLLGRHSMFYFEPLPHHANFRVSAKKRSMRSVLCGQGFIKAAKNPDAIRLSDLSGYEDQRQVIVANTLRFIHGNQAGGAANNILLYGDRGTGKSATVKAICNEFAPQGLRLVEMRKEALRQLPKIMEWLSCRALRFILFIDDLSFEPGDAGFTLLKALLEGGIEAKPENVIVYATSNRRHLIKENMADRPASSGEVRAFDTMQEQLSLADRFGLTVIFTAPAQDDYLKIARFIAEKNGILPASPSQEALREFNGNALKWERWFNGRSPRTARQFVDWLAGGAGFPWDTEDSH